MMRTVTVVRQYLVTTFLILTGLAAYGCGDSATVSEPAELGNLSVSTGTLQPPFRPATTSYTVQLSSDVTSTTITASPRVAGDTIRIDNQQTMSQTITFDSPGDSKTVSIVVTDSGAGGASKSYTVRLTRAGLDGNNSLQSLAVSPGALAPTFDANIQDYTVDVANNVSSISITPALSDPDATMTVNGQSTNSGQSRIITLSSAGQATNIPIVVTAQNGTAKTYDVRVSRGVSSNNNLSGLTVTSGTLNPSFNATRTSYTVNVASTVNSVTVTPRLQDTTATMTVNGQGTNSGQGRAITLNGAGSNTLINIVVTAQNNTQKIYIVNVSRAALGGNNNLSGLSLSPGSLDPDFDPDTTSYSASVGSGVDNITVTPTRQNSNATIEINGQAATSGQGRSIALNGAGSNTLINIVVAAQNGNQKTYTVNISRAALGGNNNLQSLAVSPGSLDPAFSANRMNYTVDVGSGVSSISVTPREQDTAATTTVNGQATPSGQARTITLNGAGSNTVINIVVTAQNGSQRTYTVTVSRAALGGNNNLSGLSVSPGSLDPNFSANTTNYTVDVASTVTSITVTPSEQDTAATTTVNGQATPSGQARTITLNGAGSNTVINIVVTAQNGSQRTYTVTVSRAALGGNNNLSGLSVSPGNLSPSFTAARTNYTVNVGSGVDSISVTATKADTNAGMTINNQGTNSGQTRSISLSPAGESTEIEIIVTAPNGNDRTYLVTVNRAALGGNNDLSSLTVSPGSLTPSFAANTENYTVGVATDVTSVNVSATKADPNAVMSGSVSAGTGVATGQATIPLNGAGTSTPVSITVTAPNGNSNTYSITINRAAPQPTEPPAPSSAPDLIAEDDSCLLVANVCFPPTSDVDNITNVATPRFRISQPGAGQTADLYVDGSKVSSTFNSGGNTLRPTSSLSDGTHSITSTVTNGSGESDQSPPLSVTINSVAPGGP